MIILSPGLVNRKGVERGNIDISSTQIHDHSLSWLGLVERGNINRTDHSLSWLGQKRERGTSISLEHKYMIILSPGLVNRKGVERGNIDISRTHKYMKRCRKRKHRYL